MPPAIEDVSDEESKDIPFRDAQETNGNDEQDSQSEEDGDDDEEGVYVVEKIVDHAWLDDGTLKLLVKWQGYEDESDRTWEEEEGLMDGARQIVTAYYKKIGGRPQKPADKPTPGKPGRKRKSMGSSQTPTTKPAAGAAGAKKQRRQSAAAAEKQQASSAEAETIEWLPKSKNWDKDVKEVQTIVKEDNGGMMACLEFKNGHTTRLPLRACYEKCPMKMLAFYEHHLVFKDPEA